MILKWPERGATVNGAASSMAIAAIALRAGQLCAVRPLQTAKAVAAGILLLPG